MGWDPASLWGSGGIAGELSPGAVVLSGLSRERLSSSQGLGRLLLVGPGGRFPAWVASPGPARLPPEQVAWEGRGQPRERWGSLFWKLSHKRRSIIAQSPAHTQGLAQECEYLYLVGGILGAALEAADCRP